MKDLSFEDKLPEMIKQLQKGVFLTVSAKGKTNTMTISWGMIGIIWNKPIFQVLVRESRYTHSLIEESDDFTINIPKENEMKEALVFCGSNSGRDVNKFGKCNLKLSPSKIVNSPIINDCNIYLECKIIAKQKIIEEQISSDLGISFYGNGDYHTMYYGEIVACY